MNSAPQGPGWWRASNGNWYPPNPQQRPLTIVPVELPPRRRPRRWPWFAAVIAVGCIIAAALAFAPASDDHSVSSPAVSVGPSTAATAEATTTTAPPTGPAFVPPQGPEGCPPSTPEDVAAVNAVLVPMTASGATGLTLGMASAVQVDDVRYIAGDVYDSSGTRLSVVDVWAVVDGVVVATSASAVELSTAPARLDLYPGTGAPGNELVACRLIPPTR